MRLAVLIVALLTLGGSFVRGESPATQPAAAPATAPAMDQFTLVLLVLREDAPKFAPDEAAALQKRHLAHIASLGATGKLLAAGPFSQRDDEAYRGVLIFSCSHDEARSLCNEDPAVKAGRLKVVVQTWNVPKGTVAFPRAK